MEPTETAHIPNDRPPRPRRAAIAASWALVAAVAAGIFLMSAKNAVTLDTGSGIVSAVKALLADALASLAGRPVDVSPIGHFAEYLVFGAALGNALLLHIAPRHALWAAPAIASLYGIGDEIHQIFVPGRTCDAADWAGDTVAAAIGCALAIRLIAAKRARSRRR